MEDKRSPVSWTLAASTFLTLFRGWLGCAFVSMPFGFYESGYLWASLCIFLAGLLSAYCAQLVVELKYTRVDPDASYSDLSAGFCISYVIFILNNLAYMFPDVNPHGMSLMLMTSLVALVLIFSNAYRLGLTSSAASFLVFLGLIMCFYIFDWSFMHAHEVAALKPKGFPLFIGMATGAVSGIGLVIPVEASLHVQAGVRPTFGSIPPASKTFIRILWVAVTLSTFILLVFGLVGVFTFGSETAAVITGNLPTGPISRLIRFFLLSSMFLTFPLQFLLVRNISERYLFPANLSEMGIIRMWRGALIVLICFLATKIPKFALVYSFVGGFGGCLLAFVFPLVFYVVLTNPQGRRRQAHLFLIFLSVLVLIISTVMSGIELFK